MIDYAKLNKMKKQLEEKTSGNIMYASKIKGSTDIRILPPHAEMDGNPYFERINWNIGEKLVTSPETFGEYDPIAEEVATAKAYVEQASKSRDAETKQYAKELSVLLNDWQHCKKKSEYLIPILPINDDGTDITVAEAKIFSCGITVIQALVAVISDRKYMNGTEDGVADRVKGRNFTIKKSGEKKETEYAVLPWPEAMEMPEQFYVTTPNPIEFTRKGMKSEDYLRSLVRNYLYGEELVEDVAADVDVIEKKPSPASRPQAPKSTPQGARTVRAAAPVAEEVEEPIEEDEGAEIVPDKSFEKGAAVKVGRPQVGASSRPQAPSPAPRRNILDDMNNNKKK